MPLTVAEMTFPARPVDQFRNTEEYYNGLLADEFTDFSAEEFFETLADWQSDGGCEAACEHRCWVEPDGTCQHGKPSWLKVLNLI